MEEKQFQPAAFASSSQILYFVQSRHIVLEVRLLRSVRALIAQKKRRDKSHLDLTEWIYFSFIKCVYSGSGLT